LNKFALYSLLIVILLTTSCRIKYSLNPPATIKGETISIQYFPNNSSLVQPTLSQTFTEALKDKFVSQTSLELVSSGGDLQFEGSITNYQTKPTAVQENSAALNRLTISIKVKFSNREQPENDFDQQFSAYSDFDGSVSLESVESELIKEIVDQLVEDIFNKSVVNW